jgi:hypothetical protein
MKYEVTDVYFAPPVRDRIYSRGIDEDMVLRALVADADMGDYEPLVVGEWVESGGTPDLFVLAHDPVSGMYLELAFVLEPKGVARCYHAMRMRDQDRGRYRRGRV